MNTGELSQWYYLMYLLPGGAALLLMLLSVAGGGHHHRVSGGHHHSGLHHTGLHHSGLRHTGSRHTGPKARQSVKTHPAQQALAAFGIGRAPGLLVWGSLLLGWGLCGFWTTRLLEPMLRFPALFGLPALGAAVLGALGAARLTTLLWTRLLPAEETFVTGTVDLCGLTGKVVYPVDEARGRVHVYDVFGTLHDVSARVTPGQPAIARGRVALVTDYDPQRNVVVVDEMP